MMDGDCFLKMYRFANGFTVEIKDPAIVKRNMANDKLKYDDKNRKPWLDPWRSFVFKTDAEATTFVKNNAAKAIVAAKAEDNDEFGTAFDMAVAKSASDKDGDE